MINYKGIWNKIKNKNKNKLQGLYMEQNKKKLSYF